MCWIPGKVLAERYQLGELIGKGGFARVYKALDLTTGEQVAVKEIEKDLVSKTELPKILSEGQILSRLCVFVFVDARFSCCLFSSKNKSVCRNHDNIVQFIELVQDKKQIYFVMEFISGGWS